MKTILVHICDDNGMDSRLQVALDIARAHNAHLTCLQVTTQFIPMSYGTLGGDFMTSVNMDELREMDKVHRVKIEGQLRNEGVSWDWVVDLGDPATCLVERSALADMIVLSQSVGRDRGPSDPLDIGGDVTINAHCPVLIVPIEQQSFDTTGPLVIGWNGSGEAARAIRFSLSMLKTSSAVHLVSIADNNDELPSFDSSTYLSRHRIASELHQITAKDETPSQVLESFAKEHGAAAIVMGAYGHSRLRELLFGGVTRDLLKKSHIPMLMGH